MVAQTGRVSSMVPYMVPGPLGHTCHQSVNHGAGSTWIRIFETVKSKGSNHLLCPLFSQTKSGDCPQISCRTTAGAMCEKCAHISACIFLLGRVYCPMRFHGELSEWPKEHDWKSCIRRKRILGSNPRLSARLFRGVPRGAASPIRRGGRVVECGGLENRLPLRGYEGSNPSSSARQ